MKIGDVIALDKESRFRRIIEIKQDVFSSIFTLENILDKSEIIKLDGYILKTEHFKVMNREEIIEFIDNTEEYYSMNEYIKTWDREQVVLEIKDDNE